MSDLVNVKKPGEPVLKILRSSLEQHTKLGWVETDEEPVKAKAAAKDSKDSDAPPAK